MNASFRVVYFVPDPFIDGRVPIAAIVTDGAIHRVAYARRIPCAQCLGGPSSAALVRMLLRDLPNERPSWIEDAFGNHVRLGKIGHIPSGVDAVEWLEKSLLPQ